MIIFARNLVVKDFWLKLFSLALAILIWLTVYFSINGETSNAPWLALLGRAADETVITVPVRVPAGAAQSFSVQPSEVRVTLRGDPKKLKTLRNDDVRAQVDLSGVETASGLLRPIQVFLPLGISYTHLSPDEVEVHAAPKN
jgi:YbbR domain-containing protein